MTNIEIAQLISERIGQSPIPHNDIRNISYEIYQELGGESELEDFDDIYELLLTILPMAREGGAGIIDDTSIRIDKTWSSNKINSELSGKQNTLTAGTNISIDNGVISATDTTYSAANGINIDASNNISVKGLNIEIDSTTHKANFATYYFDDDDNQYKVNTANGSYSDWAEGSKTTATSQYGGNHAEGYATGATGQYGAHSEGSFTTASGICAHSEGATTLASGTAAHAEGEGWSNFVNTASGEGSHVEGVGTYALGQAGHAEGRLTKSQNVAEHAEGAGNVSHKTSNTFGDAGNTLHSVGNGYYDNARKNAFEIMENGDTYIKGVGGYDGVHIKSETGYTATQTLQDVISSILTWGNSIYLELFKIKALAPNQIRYTVNDGNEFTTAGSITVESSEFHNGIGIITYDADLDETGLSDFNGFTQDNITSIELPKSDALYLISDGCFQGQTNLKQFTIPISITEIGSSAFEDCTSLEIVKYEGTADMWTNYVTLGTDVFTNTLVQYICCVDGVVTL